MTGVQTCALPISGIRGAFTLDIISSIVWESIDGETTVETIVKKIISKFGSSAPSFSMVAKDIINLFYQWKDCQISIRSLSFPPKKADRLHYNL